MFFVLFKILKFLSPTPGLMRSPVSNFRSKYLPEHGPCSGVFPFLSKDPRGSKISEREVEESWSGNEHILPKEANYKGTKQIGHDQSSDPEQGHYPSFPPLFSSFLQVFLHFSPLFSTFRAILHCLPLNLVQNCPLEVRGTRRTSRSSCYGEERA